MAKNFSETGIVRYKSCDYVVLDSCENRNTYKLWNLDNGETEIVEDIENVQKVQLKL